MQGQRSRRNRQNQYVVAYVRVSTEQQHAEGFSLAAQREQAEAYTRARNQELLTVFDDVMSGAVPPERRPGLASALDAVRRGLADTLLVTRLDRLSRSTIETLTLLEEARKGGWTICSIAEDLVSTSPTGEMLVTMLAAVSQLERRMIGERTKAGMAELARQGRARSRWLPFGYRIAGEPHQTELTAGERRPLLPYEPEQAILSRILRLRQDGLGATRIARRLNNAGIMNPRTRRPWSPTGLANIIITAERRLATLPKTTPKQLTKGHQDEEE
ncbi:MAG: recombinase family protein [Myxococcales bacterium]|nr:recombinase family protein [Myxococcales bacterium]